MDLESTLDEWKPSKKEKKINISEWRNKQVNGKYDKKPGLDEIRKINSFIKKKYPDYQIMECFGIDSETLVSIKQKTYKPLSSPIIKKSNINEEFLVINERMNIIGIALDFIAERMFDMFDRYEVEDYKKLKKIICEMNI